MLTGFSPYSILFIVSVVIVSIYFRTLSPSIAGGDSGELVAEGCQLGTAHPPGYPLFTLIVHGLKQLTWGNVSMIAYYVNISSAILTSMAALFMGISVFLLSNPSTNSSNTSSNSTIRLAGSIFAIGMFSFSPLIWQYAVTAEVFPLNTFFASILIYLTILYTKARSKSVLLLGSFLCGLAICNQHTIILFEFPLILWMLYLIKESILSSIWLSIQIGICFLLGLLPYAYLPIVEIIAPKAGSWGQLSSLSGFIHHFMRKDYGTFTLYSGESGKRAEGLWIRCIAYLKDLYFIQGYHGMIPILSVIAITSSILSILSHLGLLSLFFLWKNQSTKFKKLSKPIPLKSSSSSSSSSSEKESIVDFTSNHLVVVVVITFVFYMIIFHSLANLPLHDKLLYGIHQRFWMQPNIIIFMLAGIGYNNIWQLLSQLSFYSSSLRNISVKWSHFIDYSSIILSFALIGYQLKRNYHQADQSNAYYFKQYAKAMMDPLPSNTILFINYDMQWTSLRYMHICEGYRPDLTIINLSMMTYPWFKSKRHHYPHITFPGYFHSYSSSVSGSFSLYDFVEANNKKHRIFLSGKFSYVDPKFTNTYELVPYGISSEIVSKDKLLSSLKYYKSIERIWKQILSVILLPDSIKYPEETWEWTIGRDFKNRIEDTTAALLDYAIKEASTEPIPIFYAVYWLECILAYDHQAPSSVYKNAGLAHIHLIQNKYFANDIDSLPSPKPTLFQSLVNFTWPSHDWKAWSSRRVLHLWGKFLKFPDSNLDPQISTIRGIYDKISVLDK